ncbi:hypothetical protein C0Q70_13931 [Pomacea canaliculata]|uniref:Uncharacterized protein n=1 Tax=Pomacea canaliculata TaxID=400727 RepID=A0A2T7NYN1_POMCA|nr:hypothetical protein C0Q70_13931 [Pomacea canaliculata]
MNEDNAEDNALEPDDIAEEASYQQTGQSLADELSSFGKDSEATESETEGETPNIGKDNEATESETEGETPNIGKDNEATESEMEGETPNAGKDNETAESGLEGETIVSKAIESNGSCENFWGKVDTDDAPGSCSTAPEQCDITPSKDEEQMAAAVEDKSSIEPVLEASTLSSTQSSLDQQSGATEQMSPSVLEPDGCISSENVVLAPLFPTLLCSLLKV